jgi:hypothetical protein
MAKTLLCLSLDEQHTSTPRLCDLPPRSSTPRQESIRTRPERAPGKRPVFTQVETELAVPHTRDRQPVLHYIAKSELNDLAAGDERFESVEERGECWNKKSAAS